MLMDGFEYKRINYKTLGSIMEFNGLAKPKDSVVLHYPCERDPRGDHQYCPVCFNNWLESVWLPPITKPKKFYPFFRCPNCGWQGQDRYLPKVYQPWRGK